MKRSVPAIIIAILVLTLVVETGFLLRSRAELKGKNTDAATLSMQDFGKGIDGVRVQVKIRKTVNNSEFTDSLYYTPDEWAGISKEAVEKAVQQRIDSWTKTVTAASAPTSVPTKEPVPGPAGAPDTPTSE